MEAPQQRRVSVAEYLAIEGVSTERLEYRDGFVVALAVPTKNHARIAGNLVLAFGAAVRARGCDFFSGDAKILTERGDRLIPDFLITCDDRDRAGPDERGEAVVRYPTLVIEILSPATAADDLTEKLDAYRSLPSLAHYVVIDSRRRLVHVYERLADGRFATRGNVAEISIPSLETSVTIEAIYRDTSVPQIREYRLDAEGP